MKLMRNVLMAGLLAAASLSQAVEVVLCGGVALRSWENLRGPLAHDNWWANFVRASTVYIDSALAKNPEKDIVWIVYRPAYIARGKENQTDYISRIRETAAKRKLRLRFVDTAEEAYRAINKAPRNKKDKVTAFYYFGHSNPHAFMLDYSSTIMAASAAWIHEKDLASKINKEIFAPDAECWSYGCYTGRSMSRYWKDAFGVPMWGNMESTRYQPVGEGKLPAGAGKWVQ
jgi:hypothetical protein